MISLFSLTQNLVPTSEGTSGPNVQTSHQSSSMSGEQSQSLPLQEALESQSNISHEHQLTASTFEHQPLASTSDHEFTASDLEDLIGMVKRNSNQFFWS